MINNTNTYNNTFFKCFKMALIFIVSFFFFTTVSAQVDTTKPQTITIISSYKPVLRSAAKINFSGSNMSADTSKVLRPYKIPVQNLYYAYQPISLKPLAIQNDLDPLLGNRYWIKAGIGNYKTPYLAGAARLVSADNLYVNTYLDYISSKGKLKNQDYSLLSLKGTGSYFFPKNELYGTVKFNRNQYYLYGYDHELHDYSKSDVSQQFNDFSLAFGFKNTTKNKFAIDYNPNLSISLFSNKLNYSETTIDLKLPVEKKINEVFTVKLNTALGLTTFKTKNFIPNNLKVKNNVFEIDPSVQYNTDLFKINAGISFINNNGKGIFMPNISAEFSLKEQKYIFQGGWIGKINKNSIRNLTSYNPYVSQSFFITGSPRNTLENELYGGIKTSISKHFLISARASFISYQDFQFFINDTNALSDGKSFFLSNEEKMRNLRLHGEISYIIQEKLNVTAGLTITGYNGLKNNTKAWNTLPLECNASAEWSALKKLKIKGLFYFFAGSHYLDKNNVSKSFKGATDLSIGAEYKINKQLSAFLDLNNIFGKNYERWHQYPVYGFNVLGGVSMRF